MACFILSKLRLCAKTQNHCCEGKDIDAPKNIKLLVSIAITIWMVNGGPENQLDQFNDRLICEPSTSVAKEVEHMVYYLLACSQGHKVMI